MDGSCWYADLAASQVVDAHVSLQPVTATFTVWSISQLPVNADAVFQLETGQWMISFYATAIVTNLLATGYGPSSCCRTESSSLTLIFRHPCL